MRPALPTYGYRSNWCEAFGPLDMRMPVDAAPAVTDWDFAWENGLWRQHEDWLDRLNPDGTWGSMNPAEQAGSGIVFGYSYVDPRAVIVAEAAMNETVRRGFGPDLEHGIREKRWAMTAWEMTHDTRFARKIVYHDMVTTGQLSDTGVIHLGDPGWIPDTLAQYHAMAQAEPGRGLPWNGRKFGWAAYGRAMRHKVDRKCSPAWADMLLETCALAACPGTGQQVAVDERGATRITSTFHEAILIHGVLALCYRLHRSVPYWVFDWMDTIAKAPTREYYGMQSPVRFWSTQDGVLVPSEIPDQQGDPGFAYWSTNCVVLYKLTGDELWKTRATQIGPQTATDRNSQILTMLRRGLQS